MEILLKSFKGILVTFVFMENRQKLKAKLKKKREERKGAQVPPPDPFNGETDFMSMMDNVNKILRTNPQMVQQISKCVSNVMGNKDLMESLTGQLEKELKVHEDQTFESKSEGEQVAATSNESTQ
jgi:hypothetical protein